MLDEFTTAHESVNNWDQWSIALVSVTIIDNLLFGYTGDSRLHNDFSVLLFKSSYSQKLLCFQLFYVDFVYFKSSCISFQSCVRYFLIWWCDSCSSEIESSRVSWFGSNPCASVQIRSIDLLQPIRCSCHVHCIRLVWALRNKATEICRQLCRLQWLMVALVRSIAVVLEVVQRMTNINSKYKWDTIEVIILFY